MVFLPAYIVIREGTLSGVIKEVCSLATRVAMSSKTTYHPMGIGMVERFNKTLLNMLGTLEETQNRDWKSIVLRWSIHIMPLDMTVLVIRHFS